MGWRERRKRRVRLAAEERGVGAQRGVRRKSWGSWQQTRETEMEIKGGARHLAIILGHLAERIALGVPRA